jgi:hypothetical protein
VRFTGNGPRLPFEPLQAAMSPTRPLDDEDEPEPASVADMARRLRTGRKMVHQWRLFGVPYYTADRLAARLGLHPQAIWGHLWYEVEHDEDLEAYA